MDVGLTRVTNSLQDLAASSAQDESSSTPRSGYALIVVARSSQPSILISHLPQMVSVSSSAHSSLPPTRLVGLSKACEDRLTTALGIPRASCIGIRDGAPRSQTLVDFTRKHVPAIDAPWLEDVAKAEYKEIKIDAVETKIGSKKQRVS